jgi:hypothetical protein
MLLKRPKENMTANKGQITRIVSGHLWVSCLILGCVLALCYAALSAPAKRRMAQPSQTFFDKLGSPGFAVKGGWILG